ncbi:MAG: Mce-associated rane protein [Nocardioidaceae bacterium]|jgi:Mce-associated membrane protein|nr:Mce-associated rane protein [Nocardioidaceae bacterium]
MTVNLRPERARPTLLIAGLVAAVLAAALLGGLWLNGRHDARLRQSETAARQAAKTYAVDLTTYDYTSLDHDFGWVTNGATASFAKEYASANAPLRTVIAKLKARATGTVTDAAATAKSTSKVEVLLFVDQTIVNGTNSKKRTERNRVVMTMVQRNGRWIVDDVALR